MKITKIILMAVVSTGILTLAWADNTMVVTGKKVKIDYTLNVNNEEVETSVGKQPLEFVAGDGTIIPGLEKGIEGMKVNEEKVIEVDPKDAYGEVDPKAIKEFPRTSLPATPEPKVGMVLQAQAPDGESFPATISAINGDKVSLDFNHPLAGKKLSFKIKVLEISDAPAEAAMPEMESAPIAEATTNTTVPVLAETATK